jgi:hypothetical protein
VNLDLLDAVDQVLHLYSEMAGWDERYDLFEINDPRILSNASRVGALVPVQNPIMVKSPWGKAENFCKHVVFSSQPYLPNMLGSAFLWDSSTIITARHVVQDLQAENMMFVQGHSMIDPGQTSAPSRGIQVASIREATGEFQDWAVLKLSEAIPGVTGLEIPANLNTFSTGKTYMAGHPLKLPIKVAINGGVIGHEANHILTHLDAYECNSGSPVFDADTHELVGIFVGVRDGLGIMRNDGRKVMAAEGVPSRCRFFVPRHPMGPVFAAYVLRLETLPVQLL